MCECVRIDICTHQQCPSSFSFGMKKGKCTRILLSGPAHCLHQTTKALSVTIRMNVYLVFISRNGSVFHLENDSEGNCYNAAAADYTTTRLHVFGWAVYSFSLKPRQLSFPYPTHIPTPESHYTHPGVSCFNKNVHLQKIQGVNNADVFFRSDFFCYILAEADRSRLETFHQSPVYHVHGIIYNDFRVLKYV